MNVPWNCNERRQFSVKVGTIFEDSPIGLNSWLPAVWMIVNDKNGISSYEVARALGVTPKSAWLMTHHIRLAMQRGAFGLMRGGVEADEPFFCGKARFMHKHKGAAKIHGPGEMDKSAVMGLLERHGPDGHSRVRVKGRDEGNCLCAEEGHREGYAGLEVAKAGDAKGQLGIP